MKTVAFFCDAIGQALNGVAIAQQLKKMDVHCVILADTSFKGIFAAYGFQEYLLNIHGSSSEDAASHVWADHVKQGQSVFSLPTIELIDAYIVPYYESIVDSAIDAQEPLKAALREISPDFICVDDVVLYPAIKQFGCPWARVVSCAETEIPDPNVPPHLSGYSIYNRTEWDAFRKKFRKSLKNAQDRYNRFLVATGEKPMPTGTFIEPSSYINFLIYPKAISYWRSNPFDSNKFIYLNACVREEPHYTIPNFDLNPDRPLVYLSYGSMGSEPDFIRKQVAELASADIRVLISVPEDFKKPETCPGNIRFETFLPQPAVIPQADVVVHHGGNNTFNETLFFGKPSVILPFAWDGFDNAMRVRDLRIGTYLNRYSEGIDQLVPAIHQILNNTDIRNQLNQISLKMQENPGAIVAAQKIFEWIR